MPTDLTFLRTALQEKLSEASIALGVPADAVPPLENPKDPSHGDFAFPAFRLAKALRRPPLEIAQTLSEKADLPKGLVASVEAVPPGYLNIRLQPSVYHEALEGILSASSTYGQSRKAADWRLLMEFVSANPTGPLNVVNARAAAIGDTIRRLLQSAGASVATEYYVNDAGVQARLFGESLLAACDRIQGKPTQAPENGYQGAYMEDLARECMATEHWAAWSILPKDALSHVLGEWGMGRVVAWQKKSLDRYRVPFDRFFSERNELHATGKVKKALGLLKSKNLMYDKEGASWIKVSEFGAPKDEVLVKSDGLPAYFAADIAYHMDKFDRGFKSLLDIWGPDHHGHIIRMTAALKAAGYPADKFTVLIGQQVSLLSGGEKVKMSKREGKFVTLEELLDDVGVDAARFFFVMRTASSHLDFDLEVAKKQTDENPVFYVQYAHARICSLLKKCSELGLEPSRGPEKLASLTEKESIILLREILSFPEQVAEAGMTYEPHRLVAYLNDLAASFHGFYTQHRIKEAPKETAEARLALALGVRIVLKNALDLLGVSAPEAM